MSVWQIEPILVNFIKKFDIMVIRMSYVKKSTVLDVCVYTWLINMHYFQSELVKHTLNIQNCSGTMKYWILAICMYVRGYALVVCINVRAASIYNRPMTTWMIHRQNIGNIWPNSVFVPSAACLLTCWPFPSWHFLKLSAQRE